MLHGRVFRLVPATAIALVIANALGAPGPTGAYPELTPEQVAEQCANLALRLSGKGQDPGVAGQLASLGSRVNELKANLNRLIKEYNEATEKGQEADFAGLAGGFASDTTEAIKAYFLARVKALKTEIDEQRQTIADTNESIARLQQERTYLETRQKALGCGAGAVAATGGPDLSGTWEMTWRLSGGEVDFVGPVRRTQSGFAFDGNFFSSDEPYLPKSGSVECNVVNVAGEWHPQTSTSATVACKADFSDVAWIVTFNGTIQYSAAGLKGFNLTTRGSNTMPGKTAGGYWDLHEIDLYPQNPRG